MADKRRKSKLKFSPRVAKDTLTPSQYERSMELLAKLIAQAYAADNPQLFKKKQPNDGEGATGGDLPGKAIQEIEAA